MRSGSGLVLAAALAAACSSNAEPHGSPVLLNVYWITPSQSTPVWSMANPTAVVSVPAAAQEVDFVFDRLLDGDRIEDTVTQNGMPVTVPKATPPITVGWADSATAMSVPPFADQVRYNSEPLYGGTTAFVLLQPVVLGFPSADTITFALDKTGLTSAYGDQMTGPAQIAVATAPFSASFRLSSNADASVSVPPNFILPITFSNRVSSAAALAAHVHVTSKGAAIPSTVTTDASDPAIVYLSAASCLGGWPAGAPIDVAIDVGATDAFGVALAAPATATFTASGAPTTSAAPDGGCGSDAGSAVDGSAADAGSGD